MNEFFVLYNNQQHLSIEIGHNSIADWCIQIFDIKLKTDGQKGLIVDIGQKGLIVDVQECHSDLAFAKAYVQLCEHLSNFRGGY